MVAPLVAAAGIGALAQLGGSFMSAQGAAAQNAAARDRMNQEYQMFQRTNDLNQWYFQKQYENELYLSGSAYQRAMADMKAAGLNPMLAYQQGGAGGHAGSGSAASGSLSDPMPQNPAGEIGRGISRSVSSALDAANSLQAYKNAQATEAQTQATTDKTKVDTNKSAVETINTMANTDLTNKQIQQLDTIKGKIIADTVNAYAGAGAHSATAEYKRAEARRSRNLGHKEEYIGYGDYADKQDQIEKLAKRAYGGITGLGQGAIAPVPNPAHNKDMDTGGAYR